MDDARSAVTLVRIRPEDAVVPPECACCGAEASRAQPARLWFQGRGLLVPYCTTCHRHAVAAETREAALALSTALVTATAAFGLPLLLDPLGRLAHVGGALFLGAVPWLALTAFPRRAGAGHAAAGRAAVFRPNGVLACRSRAFAERLARASGVTTTLGRGLPEAITPWLVATWMLAAAGALILYERLFPVVHVVNATSSTFTVLVDGRARGMLGPARSEGAFGVAAVRILAGRRTLAARTGDGRLLDPVQADVRPGGDYLYSPASVGTCFWVETAGYGRTRDATVREPLHAVPPFFWRIEPRADVWFSPLPPPSSDGRFSGGILRAVRRAPCDGGGPRTDAEDSGGGAPARPFATEQK